MTDISKCTGETAGNRACPYRQKCWRFKAPADNYRQAYMFPSHSVLTEKCEWQIPLPEKISHLDRSPK